MPYIPPEYPTDIPSPSDLPDRQDDIDIIYAARYNELKKELLACLTELGTLPKGSYTDVKLRLDQLEIYSKYFNRTEISGLYYLTPTTQTDNFLLPSDFIYNGASRIRATGGVMSNLINMQWTKVVLGTKTYDNLGEFDNITNYRFTATKAGYYQVNAGVTFYPVTADKSYDMAIYINGTRGFPVDVTSGSIDDVTTIISDVIYLGIGGYIELYVRSEAGVNTSGIDASLLSIHKLS